jgi:hypothetical protein
MIRRTNRQSGSTIVALPHDTLDGAQRPHAHVSVGAVASVGTKQLFIGRPIHFDACAARSDKPPLTRTFSITSSINRCHILGGTAFHLPPVLATFLLLVARDGVER